MVGIITLTACSSSNKYDDELRELEEIHNMIKGFAEDMGHEIPEFGQDLPADQTDNSTQYKAGYTLIPQEAMLHNKTGRNKYVGKKYYADLVPVDYDFSIDGYESMMMIYMHEGPILWEPIIIIDSDTHDGWSDLDFTELYTVYFEYLGYSEEHNKPYGRYESHEIFNW
jgi:hypothetical protein